MESKIMKNICSLNADCCECVCALCIPIILLRCSFNIWRDCALEAAAAAAAVCSHRAPDHRNLSVVLSRCEHGRTLLSVRIRAAIMLLLKAKIHCNCTVETTKSHMYYL